MLRLGVRVTVADAACTPSATLAGCSGTGWCSPSEPGPSDLGRTLITAITPTRRQAEQVVAAFERTPAEGREQKVAAWWPDGNGTRVSGVVGAGR